MARRECRGVHDLLRFQRRPVAKDKDFKLHRKTEQGNQEEDESGRRVPEPGIVREADRSHPVGTARGLDQ